MIEYTYQGDQGSLTLETKTSWARGVLNDDTYFIHGTGAKPSQIEKFGISPIYSREYLADKQGQKIGSGKMIFTFLTQARPGQHRRSPAVEMMWGKSNAFVFKAPRGTVYYSQNGHLGTGKEIAFPYIVESSDIEYYIPENSNENLDWKNKNAIIRMVG